MAIKPVAIAWNKFLYLFNSVYFQKIPLPFLHRKDSFCKKNYKGVEGLKGKKIREVYEA